MVGAGRPSTFCFFAGPPKQKKTRGWSACADHDPQETPSLAGHFPMQKSRKIASSTSSTPIAAGEAAERGGGGAEVLGLELGGILPLRPLQRGEAGFEGEPVAQPGGGGRSARFRAFLHREAEPVGQRVEPVPGLGRDRERGPRRRPRAGGGACAKIGLVERRPARRRRSARPGQGEGAGSRASSMTSLKSAFSARASARRIPSSSISPAASRSPAVSARIAG